MKIQSIKRTVVFLLAAFMLLILFGCGGNQAGADKTAGTSTAVAQNSTAAATPQPTETPKTKLSVMSWWDISKATALQQLKAKFEEQNPNIELDFPMIGKGYATKLLTMIASGGNDIPDVAMLAADKLPMFASKGAVLDLSGYITDQYKKDTYPMVQNACTFGGKTYAVARDVTSMVMFCNTKMFSDAKVDLPSNNWTIDQFLDIAKKLTKVDANGKPVQWGYYFAKYEDTMYDWLLLNGGDYATADGKQSLLGSAGTKAGFQFMQDLIYKYKVCPTDTQAKQFGDDDSAPIVAGKVAMTIGGLSMSVAFDTATPKVEYALRPLPLSKDGKRISHAFVNTWTIPKGAKNPDLSWKVLEFFSGKDGQQIVLDNNMGLPANKSVDTTKFLATHPDNKYLMQSLDYAVPFRTLVYGADFYNMVRKELEPVWLNQKSINDAVASMEAKAGDILAGNAQK